MGTGGKGNVKATVMAVVAAVVLLVPALAGCGGGGESGAARGGSDEAAPRYGGTLEAALQAEAETLDPTQAVDGASAKVIEQIMEPLFKANREGKLEPWLAQSATESADHLTRKIELRPGVSFSNGQTLTSADVAYSLERLRKSASYSYLFEPVVAVRAAGPRAVEIKTKTPMPALEAVLSGFDAGIVPKNLAGMSEKRFAEDPVGTGPFILAGWKRGQAITLKRNPHYWRGKRPYLDQLVFNNASDPNSRVQQLLGGDLDVIEQPPWSQLKSLESNPELVVDESSPKNWVDSLVLNVRKKLFADRKVREAANLAIDRVGIVNTALAGLGTPAGSWLTPGMPYWDESIEPPTRDVKKAGDLLHEGVQGGAQPKVTLLYIESEDYARTAAQIIQQNLNEVGFDVSLQPLDEATVIENLVGGEYDLALVPGTNLVLDPSSPVASYTAYEGWFSGGPVKEIEALGTKAAVTVDPAKRSELYAQIQQKISENLDVLPLDYEPSLWARSSDVAGFWVNSQQSVAYADTGFSN